MRFPLSTLRGHVVAFRSGLIFLAAILLLGTASVRGQIIANYNFDSVPLGSPVPTTAPGVDPYPQQTVYSVGGFPDTGPLTGTVTVQDVGSLFHAALMSTSQGGTGALFMDTQMLVPGTMFSFRFDIDVITTPITGLPQAVNGAPNGQAFAIQMFGLDSTRFLRLAVVPTGATGGSFSYRLPGAGGDLVAFGSYLNGETHHIDVFADQSTGLMSIVLDNVAVATNVPLVAPTSGLSEVFFFQNGVEGVNNQIALDNIQFAAVPEPSTVLAGVSALGGLGWSLRRRRRRASHEGAALAAE